MTIKRKNPLLENENSTFIAKIKSNNENILLFERKNLLSWKLDPKIIERIPIKLKSIKKLLSVDSEVPLICTGEFNNKSSSPLS